MASPGRQALVRVMSDATPTVLSNQSCTAVAGSGNTIYEIDNRTMRYWSKDYDVVVEVDTGGGYAPVTSGFLIQHCGGRIHFATALDPGDDVRVSGRYVVVVTAAKVADASIAVNGESIDVSTFGNNGWRDRIAGLADATGTLTGFYDVDNLFQDRMLDAEEVIIEFDADTTDTDSPWLAVYAMLNSQELQGVVSGAVDSTVGWESNGHLIVEPKP